MALSRPDDGVFGYGDLPPPIAARARVRLSANGAVERSEVEPIGAGPREPLVRT